MSSQNTFPWEQISSEIIKTFLIRISKIDKMKAEFIVKKSLRYKSLHDYFIQAILKQIENDIKKIKWSASIDD